MGVLGWAVKPGSFWPSGWLVFAREMRPARSRKAGIAGSLHARPERLTGCRGSGLIQMMSHGRCGPWAVGVVEAVRARSHSMNTCSLGPVGCRVLVGVRPWADRLSGRGMMMNRRRDGRRGKRQRTSTALVPSDRRTTAGSGRSPACSLPFLLCSLLAKLDQLGTPRLPLPARFRADAFEMNSAGRFGMTSKLVNGPGHDDLIRDAHVSLDDPGLLDVRARGPHGHIVAPYDVLLAHLSRPPWVSPHIHRRVKGEKRVIVDGPGPRCISE
jgi:hypothetical protein